MERQCLIRTRTTEAIRSAKVVNIPFQVYTIKNQRISMIFVIGNRRSRGQRTRKRIFSTLTAKSARGHVVCEVLRPSASS